MNGSGTASAPRAERRAAPKPARIPSGDRPMYASDEGLHRTMVSTASGVLWRTSWPLTT